MVGELGLGAPGMQNQRDPDAGSNMGSGGRAGQTSRGFGLSRKISDLGIPAGAASGFGTQERGSAGRYLHTSSWQQTPRRPPSITRNTIASVGSHWSACSGEPLQQASQRRGFSHSNAP